MKKLFRAISLVELNDLRQNAGRFRDSIHQTGEKAFYFSEQDALDMASSFKLMEGHAHRVVATDAPEEVVQRGRKVGAAQEGRGVYLSVEDLVHLSPAVELES